MRPRDLNAQDRQHIGDVKWSKAVIVLLALSIIALATGLYMTSFMTFYGDEWRFVTGYHDWHLTVLLQPQGVSWSTIPILEWKVLLLVFGIRNHTPYEAALLVAHIACVFLLFAIVRRRSGDILAFTAALILLLLGSGGRDIVWASQIGIVDSVALGLVAMLLIDDVSHFVGRSLAVSAALLLALMCSDLVGLAFLTAVGVELALNARKGRFIPTLLAPLAGYLAWHSAYGPAVASPAGVLSVAGFVVWGIEASAGAAFGLPHLGAILLPLSALAIALHWYRQRRVDSSLLGMAAGLAVWFVLTGLSRAQVGPAGAGDSRFLYVGAVFFLPLLVDAARSVAWRSPWSLVLAGAVAVALIGNTIQLSELIRGQAEVMRTEIAELETVQVFDGAPDMALHHSLDDKIMPQLDASQYFAAVQAFGSPVHAMDVDRLRRLPPQAVDQVMVNLFGSALTLSPDPTRTSQGLICRTLDLTVGSAIDVRVGDGQTISLQPNTGGFAFLFLGLLNPPTSKPVLNAYMGPATRQWLHTPDTGKPIVWQLRIMTPAVGNLEVCGPSELHLNQSAITLYASVASSGRLDPGWSAVADSEAAGRAVKASGTSISYQNDVFGGPIVPAHGVYDVWYRVRVASSTPAAAEMTLGIWDDSAQRWAGSTRYSPDQVKTSYTWIKVASMMPTATGHTFHFVGSFIRTLSTDWYLDEAVMLPSGSSGPT